MPPKKKIEKSVIVEAAFQIVRESGVEALNARTLAKKLHCSTQPIFSSFKSMKEVQNEVRIKCLDLYHQKIADALKEDLPYKASGLVYINFAKNYPNLFRFIFMSNNNDNYDNITFEDQKDQDVIARTIMDRFNISYQKAKEIQLVSWIYVHGIATMLAMKTVHFDDEIIAMLLKKFYTQIKNTIDEEPLK